MKYLLLLHDDVAAVEALSPEERRAIVDEHIRFGRLLDERNARVVGEALQGPERVRSIRFGPNGKATVTDGPFVETKEALGGFYVIQVATEAEALEIARQVPRSPGLVAELWPIAEM